MIKCDLFELRLSLIEGQRPEIEYLFYTDLPAGTRVVLSCQRTFVNSKDEECLWVGFNQALEVQPNAHGDFNGGRGRIDVYASDKKAYELFKQVNTNFSAGIIGPVSDEFTVVLTVGGRQRLRAFGKNNSELTGQMVGNSGGINVVEVSERVVVPLADEFQPVVA